MAAAMTLSEARDKAIRARNALANFKERNEQKMATGFQALAGVAGAMTSGAMRGWSAEGAPEIPGTDVPADAGIGALFMVGGVFETFGRPASNNNQMAMTYGLGMLAPFVADKTRDAVRDYRSR